VSKIKEEYRIRVSENREVRRKFASMMDRKKHEDGDNYITNNLIIFGLLFT
jgi:hypothetical protein